MTEKTVLKSNLVYSDDKRKRYLMNIEWDKSKKKAAVIMLSAGTATGIFFDRTTNNVLENLYNPPLWSAPPTSASVSARPAPSPRSA